MIRSAKYPIFHIARYLGDQGTWPHVAQLPNLKAYVDKNAVLMARSLHGGAEAA